MTWETMKIAIECRDKDKVKSPSAFTRSIKKNKIFDIIDYYKNKSNAY